MISTLSNHSNRLAVIAVVAVFVAAGCGSDTDSYEDAAAEDSTTSTSTEQEKSSETPADSPDGEQTAEVEIAGKALPELTDPADDPAVGTAAPTLVGSNFDGSTVEITPDGQPKVVYFVAHWCPACQAEVPAIQQLIDDGQKPDRLDLYVVSTAFDDQAEPFPQQWLADVGFTEPVILDDENNSSADAYGVAGFPFTVHLDGDNNVLLRTSGPLDPTETANLWNQTATSP